MKKGSNLETWRTVQLFLSTTGVYEVQLRPGDTNAKCNCPSYRVRSKCKHTAFIQQRMLENDGQYAILVPEDVPEEETSKASESAEAFRTFILKYARVEVL
jgi:hypothetical protein